MRALPRLAMFGVVCAVVNLWTPPAWSVVDREKLLKDPGVYGTFAAFRLDKEWAREPTSTRTERLAALKQVVERHREKVAIDLYLMRGLSDRADLLFRIHAAELRDTQQFLVDLQRSPIGQHLKGSGVMHGLTKKANYVPGFSDQMKADLKTASDPGPHPYVIVIPIRKNADWWALGQEPRAAMMQEHTAASLPYHPTVKRKLYHSTGLDDLDFITYFETSKLEDFHGLILSLQQVKEFQYSRRFGHPTWLGTVTSLEELTESLAK